MDGGPDADQRRRLGYDARDGDRRYQIKSRRITARNPSRQLGDFGDLETGAFDVLAAVLFREDFGVMRAALIPHAVVARRSYNVKGRRRLILADSIWEEDEVQDVTNQLRSTETAL